MRKMSRQSVARAVAVATCGAVMSTAGCAGTRSHVNIPDCAKVDHVDGSGLVVGNRLVIDHQNDLPFSTTRIVASHDDGAVTTVDYLNNAPDIFRLVGGTLGLLLGGASTTLLVVESARGNLDLNLAVLTWGIFTFAISALSTYWLVTGWHPAEPIEIPQRCSEG